MAEESSPVLLVLVWRREWLADMTCIEWENADGKFKTENTDEGKYLLSRW